MGVAERSLPILIAVTLCAQARADDQPAPAEAPTPATEETPPEPAVDPIQFKKQAAAEI